MGKRNTINRLGIFLFSVIILLFVSAKAYSQQLTIKGKVTDASNGETLPGVNILLKGSNNGTTTNSNGRYEISVPAQSDTLIFSYIGYQKKSVAINGRQKINVALKSAVTRMHELVAIGYRTRERGRLTGSVSEVNGEKIDQTPALNIDRSLEGAMTGLKINDRGGEPGTSDLSILIRGKETLGDNSPLIIIDGVPTGSEGLSNLSPQDIASVNVLKDASAAIYGARAANGVILVKTKRGQEGTSNITINASSGVATFTRVPNMLNSYQMAKYRNEMDQRYGRQQVWTDKDLQLFKNGNDPITHPNTDWYAATLRNYTPQRHLNISGSGGTDKVQYFLSGDYLNKGYMFKGGDMYYNRYQIRSNIDAQVMKDLKVGFDLNGRLRDVHQPAMSSGGLFHRIQLSKPMMVARYPNGLPGYGAVGLNTTIGVTDKAGWDNTKAKVFKSKLTFDLDMDWITQGLSLNGIASYNYNIDNSEHFQDVWKVYKYNVKTEEYDAYVGKLSENQSYTDLQESNGVNSQNYYNISLNYKRSFGNHNLNGFVAYEQNESHWKYLQGYRRDLISGQKVDLFAASTNQQSTYGTSTNSGRVSYFGSISYDYDRKYLLDFTLRRDGSFNFPKQGRFGTFPSISVGWNISDEPFMESTRNWLTNLKLRSSWGIMGNDRVPSFQYLTKYSISGGSGYYIFGEDPTRYDGFLQTNAPNPNITWETARNWNIGFDASLFDEMLTINLDYFNDKRRKILIYRNASVPSYTGLSLPQENLGKVDNSGIELQLNYQHNLGDLQYNIGGNFSYNHNEIVFMDEAQNIPDYRKNEGHPMDSWLVYKTDGIFHNQEEVDNTDAKLSGTKPGDIKYVDLNGDGEITGEDRYRKYTSQTPKIQYGINLGLQYKGFGLDAFLQGQAKAENYIAHTYGALSNIPEYLYTKRWTAQNKDATYPRAYERGDYYNLQFSDFWLYDASFIRLKNLTLSYSLPTSLLSNMSFKNIRVYVKGYNLWTIDAMSNRMGGHYYDPEMSNAEGKYYPQQTIITTGLSIDL